MERLLVLLVENENFLLFGIVVNFVATFGFGLYKSMSLEPEESLYLIENYPVKTNFTKLLFYWFIPYLGYCLALKETCILQNYIKNGKTTFDFLEDKLKAETKKNQ